jgi:hypothetical protein
MSDSSTLGLGSQHDTIQRIFVWKQTIMLVNKQVNKELFADVQIFYVIVLNALVAMAAFVL